MAKKFNGKKMSHNGNDGDRASCPICGISMKMVNGQLRCAELKRTQGKSGSDARIVIKHGSMNTIRKRLRKGYPNAA